MAVTDPDQYVPQELVTQEFVLRPITVDDAALDFEAVMSSREELRLWSQSDWPPEDFTVEQNCKDLVDMAARRAAKRAYDYTVVDPARSECIGCVYIFPTDATFLTRSTVTPLGSQTWEGLDAVVYFWVRSSVAEDGLTDRLLQALRDWFTDVWHLDRVGFAASKPHTRQIEALDATDLVPSFDLDDPTKSGLDVVYTAPATQRPA